MVQEMGAFTQKCGFPCIKSERRNSTWHGKNRQKGKVRREGPVNHRIWPGIEACPCGRVDRCPALNGKSLDEKGDVSSVRALLLQKWYEITFARVIHWNLNDKIHFLVRKWQKLVEKDNQVRSIRIWHLSFLVKLLSVSELRSRYLIVSKETHRWFER